MPADAFFDPRWRIIYSVALDLRNRISDTIVCALSITDAIAFRGLDREFQRAFDSTNTFDWHSWPTHTDTSLAGSIKILEYCLAELNHLYLERQDLQICSKRAEGLISRQDTISALQDIENLAHGSNGARASLLKRRFDFDHPPKKPPAIFTLCRQIIATPGNLVSLYSQAKTGKSAALSAMMAAIFSDDPLCDFLGFQAAANSAGHAVIHFDTEQSPYDADQLMRRALRRAELTGPPPPWLRSYCLTDVEVSLRRSLLAAELEAALRDCTGIYCVLLDGVGDLMINLNDIAESNLLVTELHAYAIKYDCPIVGVLHENPGDSREKQRGHFGSQLERKSESNIRLVKETDGTTVIYTEKSRHANIPKAEGHRFKWSHEAEMHASFEPEEKPRPDANLADKHFVTECFNCTEATGGLSWKQLHLRIIDIGNLKEGGARKRFQKLLALGLIEKNSAGFYLPKL